jgi:uncharacterized protein YceK
MKLRALFSIILIITLTGCGTVEKWRDSRHTKSDSTAVGTTTTNTVTNTTVKDVVDTTVTVKGNEAVAVRPLEDLLNGKPIEATNNSTSVSVVFDKATGTIKATGRTEDRNVDVKINRTTEIKGKTAVESDYKSETKLKEAIKTEHKTVEHKSKFWWGFAVAVISIFLLVILILLGRKYIKTTTGI